MAGAFYYELRLTQRALESVFKSGMEAAANPLGNHVRQYTDCHSNLISRGVASANFSGGSAMKIDDDHLYHGSALLQIAEHPQFTAINRLVTKEGSARSTFRVNDNVGIYLKYASKPIGPFKEYVFTFTATHLAELEEISKKVSSRTFIPLVCVKDRQICCLKLSQLHSLIQARRLAKGFEEASYTILVNLPKGKQFRVYVNSPGKRKTMLGKPLTSARNAFPEVLFE